MISSIQVLDFPDSTLNALKIGSAPPKDTPAAGHGSTLLNHVSTVPLGCMLVRRSPNQASQAALASGSGHTHHARHALSGTPTISHNPLKMPASREPI